MLQPCRYTVAAATLGHVCVRLTALLVVLCVSGEFGLVSMSSCEKQDMERFKKNGS